VLGGVLVVVPVVPVVLVAVVVPVVPVVPVVLVVPVVVVVVPVDPVVVPVVLVPVVPVMLVPVVCCPHAGNANTNTKARDDNVVRKYGTYLSPLVQLHITCFTLVHRRKSCNL
jgi:hypothetical protein